MKKIVSLSVFVLVFALGMLALVPTSASADGWVRLMTDPSGFRPKKTVLTDFSAVECCRILSTQYQALSGVTFDNATANGWATYQANGFVSHLSSVPQYPGAPTGITGTRLTLDSSTKRVGMYVQTGSPFTWNSVRPKKNLIVRAYDDRGRLLLDESTDTCAGLAASCTPQFLGVESASPSIKTIEMIITEASSWSIDDLQWER